MKSQTAALQEGTSLKAQGLRGLVKDRWIYLSIPGMAFLFLFLLIPTGTFLRQSFLDGSGAISLFEYEHAFTAKIYIRVLTNTFVMALQTTLLCVPLACPLAYWITKIPPKSQRIASILVLLAFWSSSLVKNFVWLVLFGKNGPISQTFMMMGFQPISFLFDRPIVLFGMVHTMLPLAVVTMLPVMQRIDKRLTFAAQTLGANPVRAVWLVFLQLAMPGILAAGLLVFIISLGFFITPTLLGSPRETMIGQTIILQIKQFENWSLAAVLSMMLVVVAIAICIIYDRAFGLSSISSGGLPAKPRYDRWTRKAGLALMHLAASFFGLISEGMARILGRHRLGFLLSVYAWFMIFLLLLPVLLLIPMAFTSASFLSFPPPGYSLKWFATYFSSDLWLEATVRSLLIGVAVGSISTVLAASAAYGLAKGRSRYNSLVYMTFLIPMILPPIVIAASVFHIFSRLGLIGSDAGIAIGHTIMALPVTFVVVVASMNSFDWRVEQAAETLGAGLFSKLRYVSLPLMKMGIFAGFIFGFLVSFDELTVALFMGAGVKSTLPKMMWDHILLKIEPTLAAASVVVIFTMGTLFVLGEFLRLRTMKSD